MFENSSLIYENNFLLQQNQQYISSNSEEMDERFSINSINIEPDINKSIEISSDSLYFHQSFKVDKIYKLPDKDEQKFQKILINDFIKFTKICRWEDIKNYINITNGFSEDIVNAINEYNLPEQYYESLNIFYINKKRKRNIETLNTAIATKSLGRIKNEDKNKGKSGKHNKYEPDNIIKKCKRILISYMILHINKYIDKKKYDSLLDLKYSYINNLKKDSDLDLLNMKLKDIVSKDISSKYTLKDKKWNKTIINSIIQNEKNDEKLMNLLNITFNEWIDIFTYKIENEYNKNINLLQQALDKINKKNDFNKEYLSKWIFLLYNYKRWFESKKGRNTDEKSAIEQKKEV